MPILRNARHERFCQAVVGGQSAEKAYEFAGFRPSRSNAGNLRRKHAISARVDELLAEMDTARKREITKAADKAAITRADVLRMLLEDHEMARSINQLGPAVRASELLGKELGMFIDRQERRNVDEFENMEERELRRLVAKKAAELAKEDAEDSETRH